MKDRIEVNGVWYIKEDTIVQPTISQLEPGIKYDGFIFESNLYAFDCTRIYDEDGNLYKDGNVCIKFTDKHKGEGDQKEWGIDEIWDNADWMCGILENEVEAIDEAMESLCSQGLIELKEVLKELAEKGWI